MKRLKLVGAGVGVVNSNLIKRPTRAVKFNENPGTEIKRHGKCTEGTLEWDFEHNLNGLSYLR